MKRLPVFLLCILCHLLAGTVDALNSAGAAETTFFYQAYLLELEHVTDPKRRLIAPGCLECSFAEFVHHISSEKARGINKDNKDRFDEIFDNAGNTPLLETSRNLREAKFHADYDQTRLYPKETKNPSVATTIRGMRGIAMATKPNKYQDQKRKMIEALELESEVRQADNMRYFIPELEKATGVKLEVKSATTRDGREYITYDVDETVKVAGVGVEGLAQKINTAAETLRNQKSGNRQFVIHQRVIREANLSLSELRKKCP